MPPIEFTNSLEITSTKKAESLVEGLNEKEKKLLLDALQKDTKTEEKDLGPVKESSDTSHEKLLNKPNMTSTDKENMEKSIKYLVDNKMDTSENIKKLEAINYGANFIEIGGIKFSREKMVPQAQFKSETNQYNVFESDKKGIFKTKYNGQDEYYLSTDAYIEEVKKQGKKAIKDDHIRKALQSLPGEFKDNNLYNWANILGNILNMSMSGYVIADGTWCAKDIYGYLGSASPVSSDYTRAFTFHKVGGELYDYCYRDNARPCLFVVE